MSRFRVPAWLLLLSMPATAGVTVFAYRPYHQAALPSTATMAVDSPTISATSTAPTTSTAPNGFAATIDQANSGRIVGEFEHQDAIMLGVNELLEYHPNTLCEIIRAIGLRTKIIALIAKSEQETKLLNLLRSENLPTEHVRFFLWPAKSMWVRDFGPRTLVGDDLRLIDFQYSFADREIENQLAIAMAATYGMKITPSPLAMEGGNLLANGRGLCVSSSTLISQNQSRGFDLNTVGAILQRDFRFTQWSYLPPLEGEPTGHVDMFVTLTDPKTAVVGEYDPADDSVNAGHLNAAARTLSETLVDGQPMQVVRIPMPPRTDGKWRTYTNVIFANGALLVPQYPDFRPDLDRQALEIYRRLLPDWEVIGVNASSLIEKRGSLHCISRNLPVLKGFEAGH